MKGILVTSKECPPCADFKEQVKGLLASGEVVEKSFEDDETEVLALMNQHGAGIPELLIFADNGDLVARVS